MAINLLPNNNLAIIITIITIIFSIKEKGKRVLVSVYILDTKYFPAAKRIALTYAAAEAYRENNIFYFKHDSNYIFVPRRITPRK